MKNLVCVFLSSLFLFLLCSCSDSNTVLGNDVEESILKKTEYNTQQNSNLGLAVTECETAEKETTGKQEKNSVSEMSERISDNYEATDCTTAESVTDDNAVKEYRKENNGLTLSVVVPTKIEYGKDFELIARVFNNTNENISYTLPSITPNMHNEIKVKISDGNKSFTDRDTFNKPFEQLEKRVVLPAGETIEQVVNFIPGTATVTLSDEENVTMFERGVYRGTSEFCWNANGGTERILLEFFVEII